MEPWVWALIIAGAVLVVLLVVWGVVRASRRRRLRSEFGPEYDRAVSDAPTRREAEADLAERQKRRDEFEIQPLSPGARDRYLREWEAAQARFVDDPNQAIGEADQLIQQVMRERGYPVESFDQRAADLSVDHPHVVENYRAAHVISRKTVHGDADTEELRQAMVHFRSLFDELLETGDRARA